MSAADASSDATTAANVAHRISVIGETTGPTPFIENITIGLGGGTLTSISASVLAKPNSFTTPLVATYSAAYVSARGWLNGNTVTIPAFGLYAGQSNTVFVAVTFNNGARSTARATVVTPAYTDPCAALNNIMIQNNRRGNYDLSYDYILIKNYCSVNSPTLIDTDGNIRWVGTAHVGTQASTFYKNAIFASDNSSGINRIDFDGTVTKLADYASLGVTNTAHHNIDKGRSGLVLDVNTRTQTESVNLEVDPATGAVLNRWDLADIIGAAMRAGGDDPNQFVYPVGTDWFHNNSTTYNPKDNTLIVSSRENFVIAVDYDTPADGVKKIHWILGDPTKKWHQFASLQHFALRLAPGTLPPLGQHAVSIDHSGNLLLFDDGQGSFFQSPAGQTRDYSAVRSYAIDTSRMTARAAFLYAPQPSIFSELCSSVYEGRAGNYLVDFSTAEAGAVNVLQGIGAAKRVVFDMRFPEVGFCGSGWNSLPIVTHKIAY